MLEAPIIGNVADLQVPYFSRSVGVDHVHEGEHGGRAGDEGVEPDISRVRGYPELSDGWNKGRVT